MRVVLDVNVWVSGLLWRGVPGIIFDLAAANKITIYTSEPILADVEEILGRKKFQSKINALNTSVKELLSTVKQLSHSCIITSVEVSQLLDPDDTVILATALSANAKAIVTGDLDLLVLIEFNEVPILTPQDFLSRYFSDK
ncbi:MAG: putative toxin-antitoxin system toxin component, PIN family [Nostoc sp. DedQUE11]|nr:putative toxin-antitoxin system toxin component, PIN family [Nostoc sp. DedQUE11]